MKRKIIFFLCAAIFIAAAIIGITGVFEAAELKFAHFLNPNGEKSPIMLFFTHIGEYYGVIPMAAVFLAFPKRKRLAFPIAATTTLSWILNTTIKKIVRRPRPELMLLKKSSFSFPSGHAMNNAALYTAIIICLYALCKTKQQKRAVMCIGVIPFLIGISRVYFNVHFISDVVAGWSLGIMLAIICCGLILREASKKDAQNRL